MRLITLLIAALNLFPLLVKSQDGTVPQSPLTTAPEPPIIQKAEDSQLAVVAQVPRQATAQGNQNFYAGLTPYIHHDFCAAIVIHPSRITRSSFGQSIRLKGLGFRQPHKA